MATKNQIAANRRNARKSTGPRTPEGKAASRLNALKSGIDAESEIIPAEKAQDLAALAAEYHAEHAPASTAERALVDILVHNEWLLRRLRRLDAELLQHEFDYIESFSMNFDEHTGAGQAFDRSSRTFERIQRRMNAAQRNYERALKELTALQSARIQTTSEELASFRKPPAPAPPPLPVWPPAPPESLPDPPCGPSSPVCC